MLAPAKVLLGVATAVLGGMLLAATPVAVQAQGAGPVRCESQDGRINRCSVPWRDARLVRQESNSPCRRGDTWGVDRGGLWVDRGCRGLFVPAGGGPDYGGPGYGRPNPPPPGGGWQPGPDWNREIRLQCESRDKHYSMCQVDVGAHGDVRLLRQDSGTDCRQGYSWGWNRAGVWVDHGCRGMFAVNRRW